MSTHPSSHTPVHNPPQRIRFEIAPKSIAAVVLTGFGLWLLHLLWPILLVIICAMIWVGTVNPAARWLEARPMKRIWAVTIIFGTGTLMLVLLGFLILPPLLEQVSHLLTHLPSIQAKAAAYLASHRLTQPMADAVRDFAPSRAATGTPGVSAFALTIGVAEIVGYAASSVALAIYFMLDFERVRGFLFALTPRAYHLRLATILLNIEPIVGGYMRGQVITSVAIAVFTFGLLWFCGVPNALSLAAFAGLTDVLPFIGGLLATGPAAAAALAAQGKLIAITVLITMVAYQEFETRVLVPGIYGRVLRLPSAAVIIALMIGGKLGGVLGALLALPLAAVLRMLIEELRLELPGDDSDVTAQKRRAAKAEQLYAQQSAGASPVEAGAMANEIADHIRETGTPELSHLS